MKAEKLHIKQINKTAGYSDELLMMMAHRYKHLPMFC
jgi:hypothetical protein